MGISFEKYAPAFPGLECEVLPFLLEACSPPTKVMLLWVLSDDAVKLEMINEGL